MTALHTLASIALLLLILGRIRQYRVDRFREEMFRLRDELFRDAAAGRIQFDSIAYRHTRLVLNGMARFAHRITLLDLLAFRVFVRKKTITETRAEIAAVAAASSAADRELCDQYLRHAHQAVIQQVIKSPAVVATMVVPLVLFALTSAGVDWLAAVAEKYKGTMRSLDALAATESRSAAEECAAA